MQTDSQTTPCRGIVNMLVALVQLSIEKSADIKGITDTLANNHSNVLITKILGFD